MSVTVIGMDYDNSDGLQVSLAAHAKAHRENGDMILNLADAAKARAAGVPGPKKADPRPKYNPEDHPFPKAVYHADGRVREVANVAQMEAAFKDGFRKLPYPVVRAAVGDPGAEKAALIAKIADGEGKLATQNELLLQLGERLKALEVAAVEAADPKPKK